MSESSENSCRMRPTDPLCRPLVERVTEHPLLETISSLFLRDLNRNCPLKFVHSSFHGVGHVFVQQAFQTFGFHPPIPVPEQKDPDPNFSSLRCPNPEEGESVLVRLRSQFTRLFFRFSVFVGIGFLLCCRSFLFFWQSGKTLGSSWQRILMPIVWL